MTIDDFCGNFGNFDENRPPQAVEFCVFTLFSCLPGVASPFAIPKIYISLQIEFLLLFSIWKLDTFMNTENKANAHVCDRRKPAASFWYMHI